MQQLYAYVSNESTLNCCCRFIDLVYCQSIPTVLNMKQHERYIGNSVAGQLNFVFIFSLL